MSPNSKSDETNTPAGRSMRLLPIVAAVAMLLAASGITWYLNAASRYREEQAAIRELESLVEGRGMRVVVGRATPSAEERSRDNALEIRADWATSAWLRGPISALGSPVFQRVKMVSIYDADIGDAIIEPLTKFLEMNELKIAPGSEISRDGLRQVKTAVPKAIIWFAHDEEGFDNQAAEENVGVDVDGEDDKVPAEKME